jgi:hypothetical protein
MNFLPIIDAVRKAAENAETRAQITTIMLLSDGTVRATGMITRRSTMFARTWIINRDTLAVQEV